MFAVSAYGMSRWVETPKAHVGSRFFFLTFSGLFAAAGAFRAYRGYDFYTASKRDDGENAG